MPRARPLAVLAALLLAAAAASAEDVPDAPACTGKVGEIKKEHNVDLGRGRLALRLTVPVDVLGCIAKPVRVDVWFFDDLGKPIRSVLPSLADVDGNVHVGSRSTKVEKDPEGLDFVFLVPYGAFPARPEGKYGVEARATLSRMPDGPEGAPTALATRSTTFTVESK
jgi:hypothetical protein